MKKYVLALMISMISSTATMAATCSCDAPPECGRKPSSCTKGPRLELDLPSNVKDIYIETKDGRIESLMHLILDSSVEVEN